MITHRLIIMCTFTSLYGFHTQSSSRTRPARRQAQEVLSTGLAPQFSLPEKFEFMVGERQLTISASVISQSNISVSWRMVYVQEEEEPRTLARPVRQPSHKGLIGEGCIDLTTLEPVKLGPEPDRWSASINIKMLQSNRCIRDIFYDGNGVLHGKCSVSNLKGQKSESFDVLFLRNLSVVSQALLASQNATEAEEDVGQSEPEGEGQHGTGATNGEAVGGNEAEVEEFKMEKIKALRKEMEKREKRRIRERDKAVWFIVGMIIPMCVLLYITLNISCRQSQTGANMFSAGRM